MHTTSVIVGIIYALTWSSVLARKGDDAVLLSKVKSLTLRNGQDTSHRRVEPLPQLKCVGGNGCQVYSVDVMRCTNSGSEYDTEDIQWTCKAQLPPEFKLGATDVICEGYDSSDDPFVLKGSCGVEYRLMLTEAGEEKYKSYFDRGAWRKDSNRASLNEIGRRDGLAAVLFWIIFAAIVLAILYSIFKPTGGNVRDFNGNPRRGLGYNGGGGGGGGGDDGHDDPPPPYSPRGDYRPKQPPPSWSGAPRASSSRSSNTRSTNGQQQGWRPGFWSGTAAGAAAGYAAGAYANRNQGPNNYAQPGRSSMFGTANTPPFGGQGAGPSSYRSPSFGAGSSSAPGPSSSRHESTGFGGTRRR